MNAKEYLSQISRLETLINAKRQRVDALRCMATNCSPNYSGMPHNPSKSTSPMADAICKALDLEEEIRKDEIKLQEKRLYILELIGTLDNVDFQTVIIKRYFEHASWDTIASTMFYSISWVYKLHGNALRALDECLMKKPPSS